MTTIHRSDDSAVQSLPHHVSKPWGYEIWWALTDHYPGNVHTIEALEDSDVLEVSTPHLDDVVRLSDNYGRQGTSAP
jgi:hypothetical protein